MADPVIELDEKDVIDSPEPSPAETPVSEPSADKSEIPAEAVVDQPKTEATPSAEEKQEETDDPAAVTSAESEETKPAPRADERKAQLNSEIRDLVAKRNALRGEVEKANTEAYQVATEQELVDNGMSELEAKVEQMRQTQELDKYTTQVAEAQLVISHDSERVLRDFPIFNETSPVFQPALRDKAAAILNKALEQDPNTGQVIGTKVPIYELYQTIADAYEASSAAGQIKGQKATEKMLANADPAPGATQIQPKEDPFLAGLTKNLNLPTE